MNWEAFAAIAAAAAVVVTVLGGIIWLANQAGRHAQRLDRAESDIKEIAATQDAHSQQLAGWQQFGKLLDEVRADVKRLLSDRGRHAG